LKGVLNALQAEQIRRQTENKLSYYKPYPRQAAFHEAGATHRERLFMAGNRVGKTQCGAAELAMHLTGEYGPFWKGKRFDKPVRPKAALGEISMARGTADLIDTLSVLHVTGGHSMLQFKSYSEGRQKWQGVGLEVVWMDEEAPEDLYFEALTRTNETGGIVYTTFTPTQGVTSVVRMFLHEGIRI
jgi:phage terminase large subunit-like protein